MSQILIIEDEIKAAKELRRMLEDTYPEAKIMGILSSVEESIEWLNQHPSPDLIFSDIQLADGLSFDIFKAVKIQAPVIFCTAFDEYAIRAFETNGIDYLLKPIDKERLQQGLSKLNTLKNAFKAPNTPLENLLWFSSLRINRRYWFISKTKSSPSKPMKLPFFITKMEHWPPIPTKTSAISYIIRLTTLKINLIRKCFTAPTGSLSFTKRPSFQ